RMIRILVLHGPNLNLLGAREPEIYGGRSLEQIDAALTRRAGEAGAVGVWRQSNHAGELVDWVPGGRPSFAGLILNAGGLTHTSVVIRDAILAAALPTVEVHLSNIYAREDFRHHSTVAGVAWGQITGLGPHGYLLALDALIERLSHEPKDKK